MPGTPDLRRAPLTVIAFDCGRRRIGAAVGQAVTASASPLGSARNGESGPDWAQIEGWIREWQPDRLLAGQPLNADGSESEFLDSVREFAKSLGRFELDIDWVDERYSSLEAEETLRQARAEGRRGRVQKPEVDAAAAVIIAERWLAQNS